MYAAIFLDLHARLDRYVQVECDNEDRKVAEKYLLLSKNLLLALKEARGDLFIDRGKRRVL